MPISRSTTSHVKLGPIGYVLASWNPLKLAIEIAWLDQLTKGRTIVGMARGYQHRWLNQMSQHLDGRGIANGLEQPIDIPRQAFDEVYEFLRLAWTDEPFTFKGDFWEFPYPTGEGTPWPAHEWTARYGTPGEVEDGEWSTLNVVPKPFQRPHPPLFAAFSASDSTVAWAAREDVRPVILGSTVGRAARARGTLLHEAASASRSEQLGAKLAVSHAIVFGATARRAPTARAGVPARTSSTSAASSASGRRCACRATRSAGPSGRARIPRAEWNGRADRRVRPSDRGHRLGRSRAPG